MKRNQPEPPLSSEVSRWQHSTQKPKSLNLHQRRNPRLGTYRDRRANQVSYLIPDSKKRRPESPEISEKLAEGWNLFLFDSLSLVEDSTSQEDQCVRFDQVKLLALVSLREMDGEEGWVRQCRGEEKVKQHEVY